MTLQERVETAAAFVAETVDPYVPQVAKEAAKTAADQMQKTFAYGMDTTRKTVDYAQQQVQSAVTTITATTSPVLNVVQNALNSASALAHDVRQDPVGTVKPYVPAFVVHYGEKTYEIVAHTADSTKKNVDQTTGMIITKVNGVVEAVQNVPLVHNVIEQLKQVSEPVTSRLVSQSKKEDTKTEETPEL
jgi:hypothetical protein